MKKGLALAVTLGLTAIILTGCGQSATGQDNRVVTDCVMEVPEGFEQVEVEGLDRYYSHVDGSNISLLVTDKSGADDAAFQGITAEMLRQTLEEGFVESYGLEVEITQDSLAREPVCGFDAYQYTCSYELGDAPLQQLVVCVNADRIYTVTYTDISGEWMEQFRSSAEQLQLLTENGENPV